MSLYYHHPRHVKQSVGQVRGGRQIQVKLIFFRHFPFQNLNNTSIFGAGKRKDVYAMVMESESSEELRETTANVEENEGAFSCHFS